ncbi:hypothetical protein AAVH_20337 [Aphelenchoides avenae]|nr:hypothetical protein AAVH_20337 [Aphelenchus avenae]
MLPVVAVEVLLFMSRRDLDKMCAVSTRLEALLAAACPFRRMYRVSLTTEVHDVYEDEDDEVSVTLFAVSILDDHGEPVYRAFATFDEALAFLTPFFRRTYVDEFQMRLGLSGDWKYRVSQRQWTDLSNVFRSGAARYLDLSIADLSVLGDNAFVDAVRCRKLQVILCGFRGRLLSDDVLRWCAANGVLELAMWGNKCEDEHMLSEDCILEFCFPPNGMRRTLSVSNLTRASDTFAVKFIERLLVPRAGKSRPSGSVVFNVATEQRGLAVYSQHLVPGEANPTYRFATLPNEDRAYDVILRLRNSKLEFCFGYPDGLPVTE